MKTMRTAPKLVATALAAALALASTAAGAEEKGQRGVITLAEVKIVGRVQKPIAAVDVSKLSPTLQLAELRQPFLDRIEKAITKDPF